MVKFLDQQGLNRTKIAKHPYVQCDRSTVSKILKGEHPLDRDPHAPSTQERDCLLTPFIPYIMGRLENYPELSAVRIHEEISQLGYCGSIRTTRRGVARLRKPREHRVYKPFETLPGQQMQVDWATFEVQWEDGRMETIYAFLAILGYSRNLYVEYTTSMDIATFLDCHHRAFRYFQGVPAEVIYDNARTVTEERVGSIVRFQQDLVYFANHYGFRPHACWVLDPESKGKVESSVSYVRGNFFYGRVFRNLEHLNQEAMSWCERVAMRIHGTTREIPLERWKVECEVLRPLPEHAYRVCKIEKRKVDKTCLISVDGNRYSVPWRYHNQEVIIRDEGPRFTIYNGEGEWLADYTKVTAKTSPTVTSEHYDDRPRGTKYRKQRTLQTRFESLGEKAKEFLEGLRENRQGKLRDSMVSILKLVDIYSSQEVYEAIERCCQFKNFSYMAIRRILETRRKNPQALPEAHTMPALSSDLYPDLEEVVTRSALYYEEEV